MPAIRKEYQCPGRGSYRAGSPCGSGGMGGTVVADVLQKDGAHGAPYGKTTACACSRVGCAVRTMPLQLNTCSLSAFPQPTSWGACPRPDRGGGKSFLENHKNDQYNTPRVA